MKHRNPAILTRMTRIFPTDWKPNRIFSSAYYPVNIIFPSPPPQKKGENTEKIITDTCMDLEAEKPKKETKSKENGDDGMRLIL